MQGNQAISFISNVYVTVDHYIDYAPIISSITNAINIVAIFILSKIEASYPNFYDQIKDNAAVMHLKEKGYGLCIMLAIPFLNILIAYLRDNPEALESASSKRPSELDSLLEEANAEAQRGVERAKEHTKEFERKMEETREKSLTSLQQRYEENQRSFQARYDAASPDQRKRLEILQQSQERLYQTAVDSTKALTDTGT